MEFGFSKKGFGWSKFKKLLRPPYGYIAWLFGGVESGTDNTVNDKVGIIDDFKYIQNNCKVFDGVGDRLECGNIANVVTTSADFSIEFIANLDALVQFDCIMGKFSTTINGWRIDESAVGQLFFLGFDGSSKVISITKPSGWHRYKIQRVSDQYTWYIDNISQTPILDSISNQNFIHDTTSGTPFRIGCRNLTPYAEFSISYLKIIENGITTAEYTFASDASLREYDITGNGNHGTYLTSSGVLTMATSADEIPAWNIINGFSDNESYNSELSVVNGSIYSYDSLSVSGLTFRAIETTGDRCGVVIKRNNGPLFVAQSGFRYSVTLQASGTSSGPINVRSVYGDSGASSYGSSPGPALNLNGNYTTFEYNATSINDNYLEIGGNPGITCDFTCTVVDISRLSYSTNPLYVPAVNSSIDAMNGTITNAGGYLHNNAESLISAPSGYGLSAEYSYTDLYNLALSSDGTDEWNFSYDDNDNIVDGLYYSPALSGNDADKLNTLLQGRHL